MLLAGVASTVLSVAMGGFGVGQLIEHGEESLPIALGAQAALVCVEEGVGVDVEGEDGCGAFAGLDKGVGEAFGAAGADVELCPEEVGFYFVEWYAGDEGEVGGLGGLFDELVVLSVVGGALADHGEVAVGSLAGEVDEEVGLFEVGGAAHPEDGFAGVLGEVGQAVAVGYDAGVEAGAVFKDLGVDVVLGGEQLGVPDGPVEGSADEGVLAAVGSVAFVLMGGAVDEGALVFSAEPGEQRYAGRGGFDEVDVGVGVVEGFGESECGA